MDDWRLQALIVGWRQAAALLRLTDSDLLRAVADTTDACAAQLADVLGSTEDRPIPPGEGH